MAGGGIKGGTVYGSTDELGYRSVENVVTVHDLHATVLHLFGIDHERFSVKFQGLDARLTGVEPAKVVRGVLA
jgi:arylsulfatase A-like enzyme